MRTIQGSGSDPNMRLGLWQWDLATHKLSFEGVSADLYGVSSGEAVNDDLRLGYWERIVPEDKPRIVASINRLRETGNGYSERYRVYDLQGRLRSVLSQAWAAPGISRHQPMIHGAVSDITDIVSPWTSDFDAVAGSLIQAQHHAAVIADPLLQKLIAMTLLHVRQPRSASTASVN